MLQGVTKKYKGMELLSLLCPYETKYLGPNVYGMVWDGRDVATFGGMSRTYRETLNSNLRSYLEHEVSMKVCKRTGSSAESLRCRSNGERCVAQGVAVKFSGNGISRLLGTEEHVEQSEVFEKVCIDKWLCGGPSTVVKVGG